MSDSDTAEFNNVEPTELEISVVARITFLKPSTTKNKRPTKDTKAKNFTYKFAASKENYLLLLSTILDKHHITKYKVTSRCVYPCKIQVPPMKQADAPDVINYDEYESLMKSSILEARLSASKSITVFAEMPNIEKHAKKVKPTGNDNESSSDDDTGAVGGGNDDEDNPGLSKDDYELAKMQTKLEKKYQNDHDAGYTYVNPTGVQMPLTPFMLKEWARALVDKSNNVDLDNPPNTPTFDPANRRSSIVTRRRAESSASAGTEGSSETALSAASAFINSVVSLVNPYGRSALSGSVNLPSTPTKSIADTNAPGLENLKPSPSQLPRFLASAEEQFGIIAARRHQVALASEGYGPDIIHLVDTKSLRDLGIPAGDVIRLQQAAPLWWKDEAKRAPKHRISEDTRLQDDPQTPPNKKFRFEQRFHNGGSCTCWGPSIADGDQDPDADYDWYFHSKELQATIPLPRGKVPVLEGEAEDDGNPWPTFN